MEQVVLAPGLAGQRTRAGWHWYSSRADEPAAARDEEVGDRAALRLGSVPKSAAVGPVGLKGGGRCAFGELHADLRDVGKVVLGIHVGNVMPGAPDYRLLPRELAKSPGHSPSTGLGSQAERDRPE